jgi:hypothetical protein
MVVSVASLRVLVHHPEWETDRTVTRHPPPARPGMVKAPRVLDDIPEPLRWRLNAVLDWIEETADWMEEEYGSPSFPGPSDVDLFKTFTPVDPNDVPRIHLPDPQLVREPAEPIVLSSNKQLDPPPSNDASSLLCKGDPYERFWSGGPCLIEPARECVRELDFRSCGFVQCVFTLNMTLDAFGQYVCDNHPECIWSYRIEFNQWISDCLWRCMTKLAQDATL